MNTSSRIRVVLSAATLLITAPGCGGRSDEPPSRSTTRVSGSVDGFAFGARVSAIAGTFWGADDGLDVVVTDADAPCDALTHQRRQPDTSVLVLGLLDAEGPTKLDTTSIAHSGAYKFTDQPFGPGRWFRVVRAFHLDGACVATGPGAATAGSGSLDHDVPLSGGTAAGQFSAQFSAGSLEGDFVAPFCPGLDRGPGSPTTLPGCSYYSPSVDEICTCGTAP